MLKILAAAMSTAVVAIATASGQQFKPSAIDSTARVFADSGFKGVIVIRENGKVLFSRAYGLPGPNAVDSKFWIGSITKSFTAAAILRLTEQRKLELADSIGRLMPGVPPDKASITVRQLLTHTSGIDGADAGSGKATRADATSAILAQRVAYPPGTHYRYMDDDYVLLAAIVEIASGTTWEKYVTRELVSRAALRRTGFWPADDWGHKGANGMSSTADDLLRWVAAMKAGRVLNARHSRMLGSGQIFVRRERGEDVYYGYGARVYMSNGRVTEVMHSGSSDEGNTSIVRILENGFDIAVLSRSGEHNGTTWASYAAHHLPFADRGGPDGLRAH